MVAEGLYKVEFATALGTGVGVIHLLNGRIWGGDAALYYVGTYTQSGNQFFADVVTDRHTPYPGFISVFGKDRVHIRMSGSSVGDSAVIRGTAVEAPGIEFVASIERIAD